MAGARYTNVAIVLHWTIAILILAQIAGGFYMHNLPNSAPAKFDLYQLHKSFGLSILVLTVIRIGWRLTHRPPALPSAMPSWQKMIARATHVLFYALLILTPLVGLAIVSVSPKDIPTYYFGLFNVPHLPFLDGGADPAAAEKAFIDRHKALSIGILILFALHAGAAIKHALADKDGVMRSMQPRLAQGAAIGAVFAFLSAGAAAYFLTGGKQEETTIAAGVEAERQVTPVAEGQCGPDAFPAANWRVDREASRLIFIGEQNGNRFEGAFSDFDAQIAFDPDRLNASWIRVDIRTASAATGDNLRDSTIPGGEWFDVKNHPTATFLACDISQSTNGSYLAAGALTIKDLSKDIVLDFTVTINGDRALAEGAVELMRTDYDLGAADTWLNAEGVGLDVTVETTIEATRQ
ncbi:MAG: cytochrome b/b6 domain-containing protein [Pseudomonadota bacterium]